MVKRSPSALASSPSAARTDRAPWRVAPSRPAGAGRLPGAARGPFATRERVPATALALKCRAILQSLEAERKRLADVIDGTRSGTWTWSYRTGALQLNDHWAHMLGYTLEELSPIDIRTWERLSHPDDLAEAMDRTRRHIAGELPEYACDMRMRHKDGHWVWVLTRGRVVERDAGGQATLLSGTHQDITAHKQAQTLLRESEQRFRRLLEDHPNIAVMGYDESFTVRFWNLGCEQVYGWSRAEALGHSLLELIVPTDQHDAFRTQTQTTLERNQSSGSHERVRWRKDRSPVSVFSSQIAQAHAHAPTELFGMDIDLSERKALEERLTLATSVFANAQEGILVTDANGRIVDVNDAFSRITGFARAEVLGQNPAILSSGLQGPDFYRQMWGGLARQGHWHGEIWNRRKSGEVYAELLTIMAVKSSQGELTNYVAVFSDITSQKEQKEQLEFITHYDVLTRLPNRTLLSDRLQQAMAQAQRQDCRVAVAFLDLDGFKRINDLHGHGAGDQLLQSLSRRMREVMREGDTLARVGGDEFVAVLSPISDGIECERALNRLLDAAAEPTTVKGQTVQVSVSIGVALFPHDGNEADLLMRRADQAMYQAKQSGKNRYHFFDAGEDEAASLRRQHIECIVTAMARAEFELYYQPKVNMLTGAVVGAEALIRWNHTDGRVHTPGEFLPGIEGHAVASELGQWVLDTAVRQLADWQARGVHLPLSVNVSAHHLQQPDFVPALRRTLARYPAVHPQSLQLEVLETSALQDMAWVTQVMAACRDMGVGFALDDFGTGYSSLTYLKRLPAQVLKIDQSFVRDMHIDPEDLTIVDGIIGLAHAFGRSVIAEGVETVEHGELLLRLGCNLAQGYGIARPMTVQALLPWRQSWQAPDAWLALRHHTPGRKALPLLFAEVEHRQWVQMVLQFTQDPQAPMPDLSDQHCQFSRALDTLVQHGWEAGSATLEDLDARHEAVHAAGVRAVELARSLRAPEATDRPSPAELTARCEALKGALAAFVQRLRELSA